LTAEQNKFQVVAASTATVYLALFSLGAFIVFGKFGKLFVSLNVKLPIQTELLMGSYKYWGILAILSAIALFKVKQAKNNKFMWLVAATLIVSILLIPLALWGVYSPILDA